MRVILLWFLLILKLFLFITEIYEHLVLCDDELFRLGKINELIIVLSTGFHFLYYEDEDSVISLDLFHIVQIPILIKEAHQTSEYSCILS